MQKSNVINAVLQHQQACPGLVIDHMSQVNKVNKKNNNEGVGFFQIMIEYYSLFENEKAAQPMKHSEVWSIMIA